MPGTLQFYVLVFDYMNYQQFLFTLSSLRVHSNLHGKDQLSRKASCFEPCDAMYIIQRVNSMCAYCWTCTCKKPRSLLESICPYALFGQLLLLQQLVKKKSIEQEKAVCLGITTQRFHD